MFRIASLMAIALAACTAPPLGASLLEFTDPSVFAAAAGALTTVDFSALPEDTYVGTPYIYQGDTFASDNSFLFTGGPSTGALTSYPSFLVGSVEILVTLPVNTLAAGIHVGGYAQAGSDTVTATTTLGQTLSDTLSFGAQDAAFFGVTTTPGDSIASLRIYNAPGDEPVLADIATAPSLAETSTPEPASVMLILTGAVALAVGRLRYSPPRPPAAE